MVFFFMFLASVVLFESFRKISLLLNSSIHWIIFSASYTSFLSVVTQAEPFKTIPELEQTNFKLGAQTGTAFQTMFTVSVFGLF